MNPILRRVREVLLETGETQRALAERGVASQQTLSRLATTDDAEPGVTTLVAICEVLGINGHWLLTGQGEKRVMAAGGADALVQQGVQLGLQRAEELIHALRTTISSDAAALASSLEVLDLVEQARAGVSPPPRAAARPARKRRSAG